MTKVIAFNGSQRKDWNTATLLEKALEGASSEGAKTDLLQGMYKLLFLQSQRWEELWTLCHEGWADASTQKD